tara:strand:+ start:2918 stop:3217 length:300 start_codon:yes stop_codon:yes gene_type:complete
MNYQLLIESFSIGTTLSKKEIELLIIELETQILNLDISVQHGCLKPAPNYICKRLKLREGTYWISCLAEVIDKNKLPEIGKTRGAIVHDALLNKGLVIG